MCPSSVTARDERPLSARSVLASVLLGTDPPRLPARVLVRTGQIFGIREGAIRVALSRMANAGEVVADNGWYELSGRLRARQERQTASRRGAARTEWDGGWDLRIAREVGRSAAERHELRLAAHELRLAPWRDGVWTRPDNLLVDSESPAAGVVAARCHRIVGPLEGDGANLAAHLWDLDSWSAGADRLRLDLADALVDVESGDFGALRPGFELAATGLRHFQADPLLPPALLPIDWPGSALRSQYDEFDAAYRRLLREWFREQTGDRLSP